MARLRTCPDCGDAVTKSAPACPKCGRPVKRNGHVAACWLSALVALGVCGGLFAWAGSALRGTPALSPAASLTSAEPTPREANRQAKKHAELVSQPNRLEFIQSLVDNRIFQKVETSGGLPRLWVRPAFYAFDYAAKENFLNVVYAYYHTKDERYHLVLIYDARSGKKIGSYNPVRGLSLD